MSTKKAASEDKLGAVHDLMAELALSLLTATKTQEDGTVIKLRPSAAEMAVIRAFLKDNDITCAPGGDNAIEKLKRELAQQRQERANTAAASAAGLPFDPLRDLPDGAAIQ